jgi:hypothetical protein
LDASTNGQIELNVFGAAAVKIGVSGIPIGFLTSSGNASISVTTTGFGGFGFLARGDIRFNVTGTVGSTLQGIGIASLTFTDAGAGRIQTPASASTRLDVAGTPSLSGGTLTPAGSTGITLTVGGSAGFSETALADIQFDVQGTGFPEIVGLATQMRLSFSCDEIRTFFRKG